MLARVESGAVYLADRGGRDRVVLEVRKEAVDRLAELLLDDALRRFRIHRWRLVLQHRHRVAIGLEVLVVTGELVERR
jgi:hypothetical protein